MWTLLHTEARPDVYPIGDMLWRFKHGDTEVVFTVPNGSDVSVGAWPDGDLDAVDVRAVATPSELWRLVHYTRALRVQDRKHDTLLAALCLVLLSGDK